MEYEEMTEEERRRFRTATFDYMKCKEIEAMEGWAEDEPVS